MFVYSLMTELGFAATRIYVCWQSGVVRSDWLKWWDSCYTAIGPRSESRNVQLTSRMCERTRTAYPNRARHIDFVRLLFWLMQHLAAKILLRHDVCATDFFPLRYESVSLTDKQCLFSYGSISNLFWSYFQRHYKLYCNWNVPYIVYAIFNFTMVKVNYSSNWRGFF